MALVIQERVPNTVFKVCYLIKPQHKSPQCNKNTSLYMIQAVTTLVAAVQSQASSNGMYSTKSGTGTGFPLSTAGFLSLSFHRCCTFIHISIMLYNLSSPQHHYGNVHLLPKATFYYRKIFQNVEL
jgi:hypothetical protein